MGQGYRRSEYQAGLVDDDHHDGPGGGIGGLSAALRAGTVWINYCDITDPALPFGGFKPSGRGREMGRRVLDSYTEVKSVWVNRS